MSGSAGSARQTARSSASLGARALADGAGDGLRLLVTGATVAGVLAVAVSAHAAETSTAS